MCSNISNNIKELREMTGLSQSEFASKYKIQKRTLQNWEQGISKAPEYFINLLSKDILKTNDIEKTYSIIGKKGKYIYNDCKEYLIDDKGNDINIKISDFDKINKHNLGLYCDFLFEDYKNSIEDFINQCKGDIKSDMIWTTFDD